MQKFGGYSRDPAVHISNIKYRTEFIRSDK